MLEIQDVEIKKLNVKKRKTNKTQILLYDTQRRFDDYIMKLKYRRNGIPKIIKILKWKLFLRAVCF